MFASHCLPTCAVCLPHLRSPCSSITRTPFSCGAVAGSSNRRSTRRSLTSSCRSHPDSERNHCRLCASFRCAPATGSVLARAVNASCYARRGAVILPSSGGRLLAGHEHERDRQTVVRTLPEDQERVLQTVVWSFGGTSLIAAIGTSLSLLQQTTNIAHLVLAGSAWRWQLTSDVRIRLR